VHSSGEKNGRFVESVWSFVLLVSGRILWEKSFHGLFPLAGYLIAARERKQFHRSPLSAIVEYLAVEVDSFVVGGK
jgi:hypothetical protein